jgi:lysozyme
VVYRVARPSYRPSGGKRVNVRALVEGLFVAAAPQAPAPQPARTWFDRLFD